MKKICLVVVSLLILIFFPLRTVWSQEEVVSEFNFDKAYQDYLYNYNLYLEDHKEYLIAKNSYSTYNTLTAKTLALEQMTKMLEARDQVLATFLAALRLRLAKDTNVATPSLNVLYRQLDQESDWYRQHQEVFSSAGSIPDLVNLSKKTEKQYANTDTLIYQSLLEIFFYQESLIQEKVREQIATIEEIIFQIREKGDKDPSKVERWLLEAKNKKSLSEEKFNQAKGIQISGETSNRRRGLFNSGVKVLEESHQYLRETNINLIETVREIKRGD